MIFKHNTQLQKLTIDLMQINYSDSMQLRFALRFQVLGITHAKADWHV